MNNYEKYYKIKGVLCAIISAACFSISSIVGKTILVADFSEFNLLLWRYSIALIIVSFIVFWYKDALNFEKKTMLKAFFSAGIFYCGASFCYFYSFRYIDTGLAAAINATNSIIVTFYIWIVDKQKIAKYYFVSLISVISGFICLFFNKHDLRFSIIGVLIALLSALSYAMYIVSNRDKTSKIDPIISTLMLFSANFLVFFIFSITSGEVLFPDNKETWIKIIVMATIGTVMPLYFLLKALRYINASEVTILSIIRPGLTVFFGIIFLHESVNLYKLFGVILILSGALINQIGNLKFNKIY